MPHALVMLHLNVALLPAATPVTPEFGEDGEVMLADPLTTLHVPEPLPGMLPASEKLPLLQFIWSEPAFAVIDWFTVIVTEETEIQPFAPVAVRVYVVVWVGETVKVP